MNKNVENNMTEEHKKKMLEMLRNSYEMYENSKEDLMTEGKKKTDKKGNRIYTDEQIADSLALMDTMQKDIKAKYLAFGGDEKDLVSKRKRKKNEREEIRKKIKAEEEHDAMVEYIKRMSAQKKTEETERPIPSELKEKMEERRKTDSLQEKPIEREQEEIESPFRPKVVLAPDYKSTMDEVPEFKRDYNVTGTKVNYDTVMLPSKGECYRNKKKDIMVAHLCAYDENMILSPNLYKNGTFLDHLLKNKIIDDINPDDLIQGDRDAIIIWLRSSGYGSEYPVDMVDESGKTFRTSVDLSALKFKKFTLKGDENGYFDYTLPSSNDKVKFRFLTNRDTKELEKMRKDDDDSIKISTIKDSIEEIKDAIVENKFVSNSQYDKVSDYLSKIEEELAEAFTDSPQSLFSHDLTNRLILSTVSINGNTDREYIANYIIHMNVKDAIAYRKYIVENEPGIDYNIEVKKPSSLGGGYVKTFLQLDQFIFITGIQ